MKYKKYRDREREGDRNREFISKKRRENRKAEVRESGRDRMIVRVIEDRKIKTKRDKRQWLKYTQARRAWGKREGERESETSKT